MQVPDQLLMLGSPSATPADPMWLQSFEADEDDFNALIDSIATPKAAVCAADQEPPAAWQDFCLPSPGVSSQHAQQLQQHADFMAQVVPDPAHGSLVGQSAFTQFSRSAGADAAVSAAGVSTAGHVPLGSQPPAAGIGNQWDDHRPDPSAAAAHQQGSMGFFAPSALSEPAARVPLMPAVPSYYAEPPSGNIAYSTPQAVLFPIDFAAAGAGPGVHPGMQYPAYAGPAAVPAGILSSMSSLDSCQSGYSNFPAAYMGASPLPYSPQAAVLPVHGHAGQWQVVPAPYLQPLSSQLLCCAGMGPAPYGNPAAWSMLPSSCLQASAHGMHDTCCPFGADCAGMCGSGSSSSNSASGHNAGAAAQHADGKPGSIGSYGVADAAAAAASVLAAAGAGCAAVHSAGHLSAGAGSFLGAAHPAAAVGTWPTARAQEAAAGSISFGASSSVQQQLLVISAQAAGLVSSAPAAGASVRNSATVTLEPCHGAGVLLAAPGEAASTLQGSRTRSSAMCAKASAQVKPPAARLCAPAKKVIAKVLRSRLAGGIQDKLQALANPMDERKERAMTNHTALQATLKSLEVSKVQVDARINAMRAEVDKMNANNAQLRAVNADLRAQVQAVLRQAQNMGLPIPQSVWAPLA